MTIRTYRLWAAGFTPSPGPVRLYGRRPQSVITGVIVDYVGDAGQEVEVGRFENTTLDADGERVAARAAALAAAQHYVGSRPDAGFELTSPEGPSLLEKSRSVMTPAHIRELSAGG